MQTILLTGTRITWFSSMPCGSAESLATRYHTSSLPPEFCHGSLTVTLVAPGTESIKSLPVGMPVVSVSGLPTRLLPSLRQDRNNIAAAITNGTSLVTANLFLPGYLNKKGCRPEDRNDKHREEDQAVQQAIRREKHSCILLLKSPFLNCHR